MENNYKILDLYEQWGFDLVPVAKDSKIPIESGWTNKEHKLKSEWESWLNDGINFGCKTGKASNTTVVDVDTKEVAEDLKIILDKIKTLKQTTAKGMHLFFKWVPELPKTRLEEYKVDIENEGGQIILYPSTVNGVKRELEIDDIIEMPEELKKFLLDKLPVKPLKTFSEEIKEDIVNEDFNLGLVTEGNRNSSLLRIGGILRKNLNITQTDFALNVLNRTCCKPPLPLRELDNIVTSLNRYCGFDERELASKILQYLRIVEEANSRDIKEVLDLHGAEGKQRVEKAIKYLVKEGFLFKKGRVYLLIKKAEWKNKVVEEGKPIDFVMPYFNDSAVFRSSDMLIIGAKTGYGKTHLAMNIIKRLADQGKMVHYISLESGARFLTIAEQLGLVKPNGDTLFNWCVHFSPTSVELEENTVSIIDWILPDDYAMVDKIYKYFAEQLVKKGGILIVFAQLKQDGTFFSPNMIDLFPAFVTKFLYDDEHGENSHFQITKIREAKNRIKYNKILCKYDWDSKQLKTIEEIEKEKI
jgi:hypothetical protein